MSLGDAISLLSFSDTEDQSLSLDIIFKDF
jgi:hypothetical protein